LPITCLTRELRSEQYLQYLIVNGCFLKVEHKTTSSKCTARIVLLHRHRKRINHITSLSDRLTNGTT
jgi:hypothetical protein